MQIPNSSCLLFSLVPSDDDEDEDEDENGGGGGNDDDGDGDDDVKRGRFGVVEMASGDNGEAEVKTRLPWLSGRGLARGLGRGCLGPIP